MADPYPLTLEPILLPKVWGGRVLADYGKRLPTGEAYGESWEVADLPSTSPTGAGGDAARSRIVNGPLSGHTLNDALHRWRGDLAGDAWADAPDFPLLVKLIDARQHLSVQVHPTREYMAVHPDAHMKSESWFVIEALAGAELFVGLQPGVGRSDVRDAVAEGRVPEVLRAVPAVAGDCHHLPSGTVHALGAGVLVAEIQSPSDTTFRLYDWGDEYERPARELHTEQALESLLVDPPPPPTRLAPGRGMTDLAVTRRYVLRGARGLHDVRLGARACTVVLCIAGHATVAVGADRVDLGPGSTVVVPAAVSSRTRVDTASGTVLLAELTPRSIAVA